MSSYLPSTIQASHPLISSNPKPKSKSPFGFSLTNSHSHSNSTQHHSTKTPSKPYHNKPSFKKKPTAQDDEDYIPYNGPYEAPPVPAKQRMRDSWGDIVDGGSEEEDERGERYGVGMGTERKRERNRDNDRDGTAHGRKGRGANTNASLGMRYEEEERVGRSRDRAFSVFSGKTGAGVSVVESVGGGGQGRTPGRMGEGRRSTVSGGGPGAQYANQHYAHVYNNTNGVGASPVPRDNTHSNHGNEPTTYRMSLASLFSTFGVGHREKDRDATEPGLHGKATTHAILPRISTTTSGYGGGRAHVESPWGEDSSDGSQYSYHKPRNSDVDVEKVYLPPDSEPDWEKEYERRLERDRGIERERLRGVEDEGKDLKREAEQAKKEAGKEDQQDAYYNLYYNSLMKDEHAQDQQRYLRPHQKSGLPISHSSPVSPVAAAGGGHGGVGVVGGRVDAQVSRNNSTSTGSGSVIHQHPYANANVTTPSYSQPRPSQTTASHSTTTPGTALATRLGSKGPLTTLRVGSRGNKLKGSISTPNLRDSVVLPAIAAQQAGMSTQRYQPNPVVRSGSHPQPITSTSVAQPHQYQPQSQLGQQVHYHPTPSTAPKSSAFSFPKGKDKWLSAETWCDALLFPRPRLRLKADPSFVSSTSSFLVGGVNAGGTAVGGAGQEVLVGTGMAGETAKTPTSGRIVSPPGSPVGKVDDVGGDYSSSYNYGYVRGEGPSTGTGAVMSRVLAHSRSLVDLRLRKKSTLEDMKRALGRGGYGHGNVGGVGAEGMGVGVDRGVMQVEKGTTRDASRERAPRPRSFAQDDMALPTPVPSLDHVLRENALFTTERAAWAQQASSSLGNKRARSVSRTRSKSLTQKGRSLRNPQTNPQSNMEYLAARACLGTQNLTPKVAPPKLAYPEGPSTGTATTTTGRGMHSHDNSLAKTISGRTGTSHQYSRSQSTGTHGNVNGQPVGGMVGGHRRSQSYTHQQTGSVSVQGHGHSQNQHSRGDSWSRSAVKLAKSTVAMCVPSIGDPTPPSAQPSIVYPTQSHLNSRAVDLEGALKRDGTKVIRLADPAHLPVEVYTVSRLTPSPANSGSGQSGHLAIPGVNPNSNNARLSLNGVNGSGALGYGHAYAYNSSSSGHGHGNDHDSRMGIAIGGSPTPSGTVEEDGRGGRGAGVGLGIGGGVVSYENAAVDYEGKMKQGEALYVPGHPYAQGGFSLGGPHLPSQQAQQSTMAAGGAPAKEASKVPTINEIITRHKAALPHLPLHPYAVGARDSYLEAYGLVGQYRHGAVAGDDSTKKMWAQLSPGAVHEILSPEIKHYSPYANLEVGSPIGQGNEDEHDRKGGSKREVDGDTVDQRTIHDTVGVGEALVNATRPRGVRERGTKESPASHSQLMPLPAPIHISDSISRAYASSPFHQDIDPSPEDDEGEGQSLSITPRSELSSRILGSPNDLEGFQDLFYRPPEEEEDRRRQTPRENALPDTPGAVGGVMDRNVPPISESPLPWGVSGGGSRDGSPALHALPPPIRRTDSGLTSLARQLNEEFEQIALEREQMGMRYSRTPSMSLSDAMLHSRQGSLSAIAPQQHQYSMYQHHHRHQDSLQSASRMSRSSSSRGMTQGSGGEHSEMQFIFEEASSGTNIDIGDEEDSRMRISPIQAFMPSTRTLPEDVHPSLSRDEGSSMGHGVEEDEDDPTAIFRVGIIGSVSTPPPISPQHHRSSFNAEMHDIQQAHRDFVSPATRARILSGLTAPLTDMTRSSYMTTSTVSRMSGLSDFPVPPSKGNHHLSAHQTTLTSAAATSLLTSYFDEAHYQKETEAEDIPDFPRPPASLLQERQLTFGGNQDADELVKTLSGGAFPSSETMITTLSSVQK